MASTLVAQALAIAVQRQDCQFACYVTVGAGLTRWNLL